MYPTTVEDGVSSALSPASTYYTPNKSQVGVYTMIVSMSMSTGSQHSVAVLTGPSSTVYASASNIYVVYPNYPSYYADGIAGDVFGGGGRPDVDTRGPAPKQHDIPRRLLQRRHRGKVGWLVPRGGPEPVLDGRIQRLLQGRDEPRGLGQRHELAERRRLRPRPELHPGGCPPQHRPRGEHLRSPVPWATRATW